jgi:hypothetical protein
VRATDVNIRVLQGREDRRRQDAGADGGVLRRPAVCIFEEAAEDLRWGLGRLWVRLAWLLRCQKGIPFFSDLCDSSCRGTSTAGGDLCHDRSILTESTPLCNRFNWCVGCSITRFAQSRWWHGAKMVGMVLQRARGMKQARSRLAIVSPKQWPMRPLVGSESGEERFEFKMTQVLEAVCLRFSLSPHLSVRVNHTLSLPFSASIYLSLFPFRTAFLPPSIHPTIRPSILPPSLHPSIHPLFLSTCISFHPSFGLHPSLPLPVVARGLSSRPGGSRAGARSKLLGFDLHRPRFKGRARSARMCARVSSAH